MLAAAADTYIQKNEKKMSLKYLTLQTFLYNIFFYWNFELMF